MDKAIEKLSEMLGVGVSEVYTVLQASAKVDGEVAWILCLIFGVISFFLFVLIIITIVKIFTDNDDFFWMLVILGTFFFAISITLSIFGYRDYKMCTENPKGYAIEKIFEKVNK